MASNLVTIASRLGKLIRLLGSNSDGEVVAAARSLERILKTAGLDLHVLAESITSDKKFSEEDGLEIYQRGFRDGQAEKRGDRFKDVDDDDWLEIAEFCEARKHRLRSREAGFVRGMVDLTRDGRTPSPKQAKWLRSIYDRLQ
jgi:hypothetical protein